VHIEVTPRNSTVAQVEQHAFRVPKDHKRHLLVHLFQQGAADEGPWGQALVFTRTKHGANRLAQQLETAGIRSAAIHGNKSQAARVKALADFKAGKVTALVATEVASRGLDIKELPQVVNYELPNVPEDYVHRIGRTARAGATGRAVSLVAPDEAGLLKDIERTMRQNVPFRETPHFAILQHAADSGNDRQRQPQRQPQRPAKASTAQPARRPAQGGQGRKPGGRPAGRSSGSSSGGWQAPRQRSGGYRSGRM
jgi:ATP-dependent RNA helicase RhlE